MTASGYDSHAAIILHRASGYSPGANGPVNAGYIDMSIPFSAGTDQLAPTSSTVSTRDGDRLLSQATHQRALPLFPKSGTTFFLKAVDAQIEFAKSDTAAATALTRRRSGNAMKAVKP